MQNGVSWVASADRHQKLRRTSKSSRVSAAAGGPCRRLEGGAATAPPAPPAWRAVFCKVEGVREAQAWTTQASHLLTLLRLDASGIAAVVGDVTWPLEDHAAKRAGVAGRLFGGGQDVVAVVLLLLRALLRTTSAWTTQRRLTLLVICIDTAHHAANVVALQEGERVASGKSAWTGRSGSGGSARPHTCAPPFRRSPCGVHTGSSDSMPASREAVSLAGKCRHGLASRSRVRRVTSGSGRLLPGAPECSRAAETVLEGGDGVLRPKSLSREVANSLTRFPGKESRLSVSNWKPP